MEILFWLILIVRILVRLLPWFIGVVITLWFIRTRMPGIPVTYTLPVFLFGVGIFALIIISGLNDIRDNITPRKDRYQDRRPRS